MPLAHAIFGLQINALNFYSPTLFAEIGITDTSLCTHPHSLAHGASILTRPGRADTGIYGVLKAVASLVFFIFLVDTLGRRPPLFFGGIMSGLSCVTYPATPP